MNHFREIKLALQDIEAAVDAEEVEVLKGDPSALDTMSEWHIEILRVASSFRGVPFSDYRQDIHDRVE